MRLVALSRNLALAFSAVFALACGSSGATTNAGAQSSQANPSDNSEVAGLIAEAGALFGPVMDIIEEHAADPSAAAEAIKRYTVEIDAKIESVASRLRALSPQDKQRFLTGFEAHLDPLDTRMSQLNERHPGLVDDQGILMASALLMTRIVAPAM